MNFNISSNQSFSRVSILRHDSIEFEHHDAIIIFAHLNIPPQKRVGKTVDASRCIPMPSDHNDLRKKWRNERKFGAKGATRSVDVYCV